MRRWNGWGDDTIDYPLPPKAAVFLDELVGSSAPPQDTEFDTVIAAVPNSRLPKHPLISCDAKDRLRHARGQSFPDWLALRSGRILAFPDGVAYPSSEDDVRELLKFGMSVGAKIIPFGGGTSVVGHINPIPGGAPILTINLQRLQKMHRFDETSHLATFGAGIQGPDLEAQLRARGFTLGHFPQSFEFSTLGGWITTRSSGQQSLGYGRIETLFAGGHVEAPAGSLEMLPHPASAAGPDLRQMILGSEGRLGILTKATVRITPLPEREDFHAVFFPNFELGQTAVRQIIQARLPLSMMRLSTAVETTTTLALAGHDRLISTLERLLNIRNIGQGKSLLSLGFSGADGMVRAIRKSALGIASDNGGVHVGRTFGHQWHKGRFHTPYLRNTLWAAGYGVDTLETAVTWDSVPATLKAIESGLHAALAKFDERVHVFTHLSHMYPSGASIYTTYLFRLAVDPDETFQRWKLLKTVASEAIVQNRGTISHQHGVGADHAPYLSAEKGKLGIAALVDLSQRFDPDGMMNPGKLFA